VQKTRSKTGQWGLKTNFRFEFTWNDYLPKETT
jgi:hypothetical protein